MKRHPALYTLSHDHHQGLILAQQLKKGAPHYKGMPSTPEGMKEYTIAFYKSDLAKHFRDEETILFPSAKRKSDKIDRLIAEIISEHRKMEAFIDELKKTGEIEKVMDELGYLLEDHIRKEERELFVEIEMVLSEIELSSISQKITESRNRK